MEKDLNKYIFQIYCFVILALHVLPINFKSGLNNFNIIVVRADYFLNCLIFIPLHILLRVKNKFNNWRLIIFSLLIAISFEFVQYFLPYRAFNINDMMANSFGIFIGLLFLNFTNKKSTFNKDIKL